MVKRANHSERPIPRLGELAAGTSKRACPSGWESITSRAFMVVAIRGDCVSPRWLPRFIACGERVRGAAWPASPPSSSLIGREPSVSFFGRTR